MSVLGNVAHLPVLILVVLLVFNTIIFVHELGHFWAAKWRGLKIDRFQIWFGKPIWSKNINGVQWGLGWIPFGGFVALPQMAPMESIEGSNRDGESAPLPKISPLDKIIVAVAGPFFSFLLALACAVVVWGIKKPSDVVRTTEIGYVIPGEPAAEAGLKRGDVIKKINGKDIDAWVSPGMGSVMMNVITSEGEEIEFTVDRPGVGETKILSKYEVSPTKWYERRGIRDVGMEPRGSRVLIGFVNEDSSPASRAGLKVQDEVISVNDIPAESRGQLMDLLKTNGEKQVTFKIKRNDEVLDIPVQPLTPIKYPAGETPRPMLGVGFIDDVLEDKEMISVNPFTQVGQAVETMWMTITKVISPKSSIGVDQLSGPLGIIKVKMTLLEMDHPANRLLSFMVLLNINLAILNMLPFPVLDGGHITMAIIEAISGRPARAKFLEVIQISFAMLLMGLMLYLTSKDTADVIKGSGSGSAPKYEFPK